jgi:hypothetical protein
MLRGRDEPKRAEVTGSFRKRNKELHNLYASSNIARILKSKTMRWIQHTALIARK